MDRLYQQIVAALDGPLDADRFEGCAVDLLRVAFPSLFPIRGGADAGMDGAIADGEGEAFPLVCTTQKNVIGNLTKSLDSYLRSGGRRRKVVLATSQPLTPKRRRNLEVRAREKDFLLVQVVDREGIARQLRWSPDWCRELGIPWAPSALSEVPKTRRLLDIDLVGRVEDLEWLRSTSGDRILFGEPGSGKTFILYQLVQEGWGLFLVDTNRTAIAEALARDKPGVVIVDDAHGNLAVLEELQQLRTDVGVAFDIVTTTWNGEKDRVADAMGSVPPDQMRRLELMSREEILEVYRRAGVHLSEGAMAHLIDQAANKPGLAVTLASIVLRSGQEGLAEVFRGEALRRTVSSAFRELVGEEAETILASFALGGDRGMGMDAVARFLETPLPELRRKVIGLAAGGVLTEAGKGALAVWPRTLRPSLLRSVFFTGSGTDLDHRPLLESAPAPASAVETLVTAAAYGVPVPETELRRLVSAHGSPDAWSSLVHVGKEHARWVVQNYPGDVTQIARDALTQVPTEVIARLLHAAVGATGELHSQPQHPLRLLSDWIEGTPAGGEAIRRRRMAVSAAKSFLASGGGRAVGLRALFLAFSPKWETSGEDALGREWRMRWGLLPRVALEQMPALWEEIREEVSELDAASWQHLKSALWNWIYPRYAARAEDVPAATAEAMKELAAKALRDLEPLALERLGPAVALQDLAERIGLHLAVSVDEDFFRLYPSREEEVERLRAGRADAGEELTRLADSWAILPPEEVARRLSRFEEAAGWIERTWPRRVSVFCRLLAGRVPHPGEWLVSFAEHGLAPDLAAPFLEALVEQRSAGWQQAVARYLDDDRLGVVAATCILRIAEPPAELLQRALESVGEWSQLVETLCSRAEVPTETLLALLEHPDPRTALAAALGEWEADPLGQVRSEVARTWRDALVRSATVIGQGAATSEYWLSQILEKDSELALGWTLAHLSSEDRHRLPSEDLIGSAVSGLSTAQRRQVIAALTPGVKALDLVPLLVKGQPEVFRQLLRVEALRDYHLAALTGKPDQQWADLAQVALDEGQSAEEIAGASFLRGHSFWGHGTDYWSEWKAAFHALESDARPGIREVARHGQEIARRRLQDSKARERNEQLYGR